MFIVLAGIATVIGEGAVWELAMNLNSSDGHVMSYCEELWYTDTDYGQENQALVNDYVSKEVRRKPANYIAIVRHNNHLPNAVKVWKFKEFNKTLLAWFKESSRMKASEANETQTQIAENAENLTDDPILSKPGKLVLNWKYSDNGCRITVDGLILSGENANDDNTHGIGISYTHDCIEPCNIEITLAQNCPYLQATKKPSCGQTKAMGTDSGANTHYCNKTKNIEPYGNYAIYVSEFGATFPDIRNGLRLSTVMLITGITR